MYLSCPAWTREHFENAAVYSLGLPCFDPGNTARNPVVVMERGTNNRESAAAVTSCHTRGADCQKTSVYQVYLCCWCRCLMSCLTWQVMIYVDAKLGLTSTVLWCSWLSRQSNTLKVSSSSLDKATPLLVLLATCLSLRVYHCPLKSAVCPEQANSIPSRAVPIYLYQP